MQFYLQGNYPSRSLKFGISIRIRRTGNRHTRKMSWGDIKYDLFNKSLCVTVPQNILSSSMPWIERKKQSDDYYECIRCVLENHFKVKLSFIRPYWINLFNRFKHEKNDLNSVKYDFNTQLRQLFTNFSVSFRWTLYRILYLNMLFYLCSKFHHGWINQFF